MREKMNLLSVSRAADASPKGADMKNSQVERLAYWLWQQRRTPIGSPDEDWFLAKS
jgi:Protein of unknown function (DUF2934)